MNTTLSAVPSFSHKLFSSEDSACYTYATSIWLSLGENKKNLKKKKRKSTFVLHLLQIWFNPVVGRKK